MAAGVIAGLWLTAVFSLAERYGSLGDFSSFYCGGEILRTRGPSALYDFAAMQESDARHFPGHDIVMPFLRPPFYALLVAPLSLLPPHRALLVWLALNAAALAGGVFLTARATGMELSAAAWHGAIFYPALFTFFNRQDVPILLLLAAGGYLLMKRRRSFAAGLILSLCSIKFHLLLLVPLALLMRKDRRALRGLLAGLAVLALISVLMLGPAGVADYARILLGRRVPNIVNHPYRVTNLSNLARGTWLRIPLILLAVGAVIAAARRLAPLPALAAGWLGSLLVAPHIFLSDYLVALPACLLLARLGRICFFSSLLLLFPVIPVLMAVDERYVVAAPFLTLLVLLGAAVASPPTVAPAHD